MCDWKNIPRNEFDVSFGSVGVGVVFNKFEAIDL